MFHNIIKISIFSDISKIKKTKPRLFFTMNIKTLLKRILNNEESIFFKQIINENAKELDKSYIIRSRIKFINKWM